MYSQFNKWIAKEAKIISSNAIHHFKFNVRLYSYKTFRLQNWKMRNFCFIMTRGDYVATKNNRRSDTDRNNRLIGSLCKHWDKTCSVATTGLLVITSQRQVGFCLGLDGEGAPQPPPRLALGTGLAWLWLYCASLPPFCSVCTLFRCLSDCMWMLRLPLVVVE